MELKAIFQQYVFQDEETGYAVLRVRILKERADDADCTGKRSLSRIPEYIVCSSRGCTVPDTMTFGESVAMEGEFSARRDDRYPFEGERSFIFTSIVETSSPDETTAIDYIANLGIRGIKFGMAERIVSITGADLASYFACHPDAKAFRALLPHNPPVSLSAIENLIRKVRSAGIQKEFGDKLAKYGFTHKESYRLFRKLRDELKEEPTDEQLIALLAPKQNPLEEGLTCYDYCDSARVPFAAADALAASLGYRAYDPARRLALIRMILERNSAAGHSWMSLDAIYACACRCRRSSAFSDQIVAKPALYATIRSNPKSFVCEEQGDRIYLPQNWRDERIISAYIHRLKRGGGDLCYDDHIVERIEQETGITYSETQRRCFGFLRTPGVKIITGNAGTGKTTIISGLLKAYTELNPGKHVALCAPTGRAAQRMTELCKNYGAEVRAYTVHKLLGYDGFHGAEPTYHEKNPLDSDLVLVDEMSMIDAHMFALLVRAIRKGALVLLCGDVDQLPSVQCGQVFYDLIASGQFDTVRLDVNYRQATGGSVIVANADAINRGSAEMQITKNFIFHRCRTDAEMKDAIISLAQSDPHATVLSTVHAGIAGVDFLNGILQPLRNPHGERITQYNDMVLCVGDTILMNHNNYDTGYVNGDIGVILSGTGESLSVQFGAETKEIVRPDFHDISLAYAMTIHKSQGSEYPTVIVVLPDSCPSMLARNLLYTAVTRAKKNIAIVSQGFAFERAVEKCTKGMRRTTLQERLAL